MASIITLSSKHVVQNGLNSTLKFDFPYAGSGFSNHEIVLIKLQLYNSSFNINASMYGNNTFTLIIPTAATTSNLVITLPDGYYSYNDMNAYIQTQLISVGAYLIDASGNNIFYMKISPNSVYYACQIGFAVVPTALPTGYSRPATGLYSGGGSGLPSSAATMRITVADNFSKVIGYTAATYPASPASTVQSFLSNVTPQINPISSYLVRCSMINNRLSLPSDVLSSFTTQGTSSGGIIDVSSPEYAWIDLTPGSYSNFTVIITDQLDRPVQFRDNQILIQLLVREKK